MADHYQTMGVAEDATDDEIRSAYLRRARALHPDRLGALPAAERAASELAMRQVNHAWSVLGDRTSRRTYDRERSSTAAAAVGRPSAPAARRPVTGTAPDPVNAHPPSFLTAALGGSVPYLVLVAIGVAVFVFTAFAGGTEAPSNVPDDALCVSIPASGVPIQMPCSEEHDGVVIAEVSLARVCPKGTRYEIPGRATALCLAEP